ncbi:MAG: DUF5681 domain-containing protein [Nitratireductor sp.]
MEANNNSKSKSDTKNNVKKAATLAKLPATTRYKVGYKKPPSNSRFQKGKSGNPRGRPKGAKNKIPAMNAERLKAIVLEEAYRTIPVQDRGRNVSIPIAQAVVRSLAVNAAKGNPRAQRLFTEILASTENSRKSEHDELLETAIIYKTEWEHELERCDQLGIPRPTPLPHPDNVIIDMREGTVRFTGPMTKEEQAELQIWETRKSDFEAEIEFLEGKLSKARIDEKRQFWQKEIDHNTKILDMIKTVVPD